MVSPVIIAIIAIAVIVVLILLYFMMSSTIQPTIGKTIDLSSASFINLYVNASGAMLNPKQVYTYNGKGIFTGVMSPILFLYVFQPAGSSNLYALADNSNCLITNPPTPPFTPNSWAGAGIVDITKFASSYNDITPLPLSANTVAIMPISYANSQTF